MLVGVPKEIKVHEYRVGLTPQSVREVTHHGHSVIVETNAGTGIGRSDADYEAVGATIAFSAAPGANGPEPSAAIASGCRSACG